MTTICPTRGDAGKLTSTHRAKLFALLLDTASDTVKHYRSDFYHDALWIEHHVTDDSDLTFFWFAARECGTSIGTDRRMVGLTNERLWHVTFGTTDHNDVTFAIDEVEL